MFFLYLVTFCLHFFQSIFNNILLSFLFRVLIFLFVFQYSVNVYRAPAQLSVVTTSDEKNKKNSVFFSQRIKVENNNVVV